MAEVLVETPGGVVRAGERGRFRVDAYGAETWLTALVGSAELESQAGSTRVSAGERAYAQRGDAPSPPETYDPGDADDFARFNLERDGQYAWSAPSTAYLPEEVAPYAADLEDYGTWYYEAGVGNVWQPRVATTWQPYTNGRWVFTDYGWTWVPYEPWGWAPFHYGRWDFSISLGWYWIPDRVWGPAWVSWSIGPRYVGWCPLGRRGRPVFGYHDRDAGYRGRAVRRGSGGWNFVERDHLRSRDWVRYQVGRDRVRSGDVRLLDAGHGLDRRLQVSDRARLRSTHRGSSTAAIGSRRGADPFASIAVRPRATGKDIGATSRRTATDVRARDRSRSTGSRDDQGAGVLRPVFGPLRSGSGKSPQARPMGRTGHSTTGSATTSARPAPRQSNSEPSRGATPSTQRRSNESSRRSAPPAQYRSSEPTRRSAPSAQYRSSEPTRRSAPSAQRRSSEPTRRSAPSAQRRSSSPHRTASPTPRAGRSQPRSAAPAKKSKGDARPRPHKHKG